MTNSRTTARAKGTKRAKAQAGGEPTETRLEDRGEIARGGQGVIRRVFDRRLERHVALKVMDAGLVEDPDATGRFLDEARLTGQLDHPNIVPIYDVVSRANPEFTMKLVEGETLAARLKRRRGRHEQELAGLLEVFLKVCDAIAFAHSRGVIHRDLKPSNIMLGEFGQVYVMDWGCALVISSRANALPEEVRPRRTIDDAPGTVIGTSAYMAPEQARGETTMIDERTDVFGLGAVLYQILTGVPPYDASTDTETMELARVGFVRPPHEAGEGRTPSPALAQIVMTALAPDRAARFPTVRAFRHEVERFVHRGAFFTTKLFPKGTLIVSEGELADEAYVMVSGRCEAFRDERGRRISLRTLGPGDVFGEGALFASEPRNASVIALEEVTAIVVTHDVLQQELGADTWLGTFVRALTTRHRDLESRHTMSRRVTENSRIATTIIHHISRAGTWVRLGVLGVPWSRLWESLAAECGVSEDAAIAIVKRTPDLAIDEPADMITLELLSMA